jgi:hypothetical protein
MAYDPVEWHMEEAASRPRKKWAAWAIGISLIVGIGQAIWAPFNESADANDFVIVLPSFFPLAIGLYYSPYVRDSWGAKHGGLDEFERNAIMRSTMLAFQILVLLGVSFSLWCWLGSLLGITIPSRPYDWSAVFFAFTLLGAGLPCFIAELTVPIIADDKDS